MNSRLRDLSGQTFGRWKVLSVGELRKGNRLWNCRCECGAKRAVQGTNLVTGKSLSCGCLQREVVGKRAFRHGQTNHPIYNTWSSMKSRCSNSQNKSFKDYGGRGIVVCERWSKDFWSFWEDMASTWRPHLELDRIDVNGNYEPRNCRWATRSRQMRNTRDSIMLDTPWGKLCLADAAERCGIKPAILRQRYRKGFMLDRLFEPVDGRIGNKFSGLRSKKRT